MAPEKPSAVSRATTQRRSGGCEILLVGSSALKMSEFPALMVEVNRGLRKKHHHPSGLALMALAELGYLKIFFC